MAGMGSTPSCFRGESLPQTLFELFGKAGVAASEDAGLAVSDTDGLATYAYGFEPGLVIETLGIQALNFASTISAQGCVSAGIRDVAAMASPSRVAPMLGNVRSTPPCRYSRVVCGRHLAAMPS
jgi:hypothetical protein